MACTRQGSSTAEGARDYISGGRMTNGFALISRPPRMGASVMMTFFVNQDGIVFQKDLRPNTATIAAATSAGTPNGGYLSCRAASFGALRAKWIGPLPQLRGVGRDAGGQAFAPDGAIHWR